VKMYFDVLKWAIPEPRHPKTAVVMSVVNREVSAVMAGKKTATQAARDMRASALREAGF
jgi:maltose-binding protein MalE